MGFGYACIIGPWVLLVRVSLQSISNRSTRFCASDRQCGRSEVVRSRARIAIVGGWMDEWASQKFLGFGAAPWAVMLSWVEGPTLGWEVVGGAMKEEVKGAC